MGVSTTVHVFPKSCDAKTRAAGPPVPKWMSFPSRQSDELLAANAPSFGTLPASSLVPFQPSVRRPYSPVPTNFPFTGSLSAVQRVLDFTSQRVQEKLLLSALVCSFQCSPRP